MNKKIILSALFLLAIPVFFVFGEALVETGDDIINIFNNILGWLWRMFAVVTVIFFLLAAFLYVTSAGSTEKIQQATNMIKYGIIGIVVALFSAGIVALIESLITEAV